MSVEEEIKRDIEEFIKEHSKHSKQFLSGIKASNTWILRCAKCEDDMRVDLPTSDEEIDEAIALQIELDFLADKLAEHHGSKCECLNLV